MRTNYQKTAAQLERQQAILKALGYYVGAIDGIWGPKTVAAMQEFEVSPGFKPGTPNHGMPLSLTPPYPAVITRDYADFRAGLLTCEQLYQSKPPADVPKVDEAMVVKEPKPAVKEKA